MNLHWTTIEIASCICMLLKLLLRFVIILNAINALVCLQSIRSFNYTSKLKHSL